MSDVMPTAASTDPEIERIITQLLTAVLGKDVRQNMADGFRYVMEKYSHVDESAFAAASSAATAEQAATGAINAANEAKTAANQANANSSTAMSNAALALARSDSRGVLVYDATRRIMVNQATGANLTLVQYLTNFDKYAGMPVVLNDLAHYLTTATKDTAGAVLTLEFASGPRVLASTSNTAEVRLLKIVNSPNPSSISIQQSIYSIPFMHQV